MDSPLLTSLGLCLDFIHKIQLKPDCVSSIKNQPRLNLPMEEVFTNDIIKCSKDGVVCPKSITNKLT